MKRRHRPFWMALGMLAAVAGSAVAQWASQTLTLQPGWNAVQVQVQPAASECGVIFSNTAVEAVYWWRREGTIAEFDVDPDELYPRTADWEYWFATNATLSTFERLLAGETYQVLLATNAAPVAISLKGKVVLNPVFWVPDEFNLVGLPVPPGEGTTFGQFFYFSADFTVNNATATVFRVGTDGAPERVFQPWLTGIRAGEAYWVKANQDASRYDGPLRISTDSGARLIDFGASLTPRYLNIQNLTDVVRHVRIEHLASETPPAGTPPLLGSPALLYVAGGGFGQTYNSLPWVLTTNIPPREVLSLKLAPDVANLGAGAAGSAWQGILEITDAGNEFFTGATVQTRLGVACDGAVSALAVPTGLWIGEVSVTKVSRAPARSMVESAWDSTEPTPVREPLAFRVIFHVDGAGEVSLLQRVLVAWRPGGEVVPTEPGTYTNGIVELLHDEALAEAYLAAHADAEISRINSVCFPLMDPVALTGMFGGSNTMSGVVTLPFDDPVNPFVHKYHPQHDNLEHRNDVPFALAEGVESFTVTRALQFEFAPEDPDRTGENRQWGVTENGGVFRETVEGLNKMLYAEGTFRVKKVSDVAVVQ